ncbi:MAG: hypothetical protein ING19_13545, partial [Azospirillum sp.]|nr:hypothetical protein [Azospirillum sp.]
MSENGNGIGNGQASQRLRVAGGKAAEPGAPRAANDPAGPIYEPLPPAGGRTTAIALAASLAWLAAVF